MPMELGDQKPICNGARNRPEFNPRRCPATHCDPTCRWWACGGHLTGESEFCHPNLVAARQHYRKMLLALYRAKEVEAFAICLNRMAVGKWVEPIHLEAVRERG